MSEDDKDLQKKQDTVRDHNFDGIEEYDNQLPKWWIGTFVVTVLFGFYYWGSRHMFQTAPSQQEAYELASKNHAALQKAAFSASQQSNNGVPLADFLADSKNQKAGKKIFMSNCIACHAADGGGIIGPNLTDRYWIHGSKPKDLIHVITEGVPAKGMVTWKGTLSPTQIKQVTAHIITLQGSTPAHPKDPQGIQQK